MLVTLEEAKQELAIIHNWDDAKLEQHVKSASAAVLAYLKVPDDGEVSASALEPAKQATLLLVREFYEGHEKPMDRVGEQFGYGYLPLPVVSLLYPHREPSLA